MQVTSAEPQKKRKNRISVSLDGEFWVGMSVECFADLQLAPGDDISAERKEEVERAVALSEGLTYCMRVLTDRARTEHQLREGMAKREMSETVIGFAIERCRELLLVNDESWATYKAQGCKLAGMGRRRAQQALTDAGIERELMVRVLDETFLDDEQPALASKALSRRFRSGVPYAERSKATAFLARRGFPSQACSQAVSEALLPRPDPSARQPVDERKMARIEREARRKYPAHLLDKADQRSKLWSFLSRRGLASDDIRVMTEQLRAQDDA